MRLRFPSGVSILHFVAFTCLGLSHAAEPFPLTISPSGTRVALSWPTAGLNDKQEVVFPAFHVQYSSDLTRWESIGGRIRGVESRSGPSLTVSFDTQPGPLFFRLEAKLDSDAGPRMDSGGAEIFGYNARFREEISQIGLLSVEEFATNATGATYLPSLTWDPTTAEFWTNFSSPGLHYMAYGGSFDHTNLGYNYQLNDAETAIFMTNGFVVSERLGTATFGDAYYRLFNADLPVFITADSVLHAWHRSYQSMLEEIEELQLATLLERMLSNMSILLPSAQNIYGGGVLRDSVLDADYFLTVARSLWAGQQVAGALGDSGVNQDVKRTLDDISELALKEVQIFGSNRWVDFSQFKVRGHYDRSERLRRYFRTMMWCGRADLRLVTYPPNEEDDLRQLGTAIVLNELMMGTGQMANWSAIENITRAFVGPTDSMTFPQLADLLADAQIHSPADVPDLITLSNLQTRLLTGELGVQSIHSDFLYSPLGPEEVKLARSFTVCGQKFIMDSWAFSQVVFDRVHWTPDDGVKVIDGKVIRRKPSALDAAFSVFGNEQVVPEIVARILDNGGVPFRDGLPYQHNLLAVRNTIEAQPQTIWTNNIYNGWLAAIRTLSAPATDPRYPEAMRTRAWAMRTLNTQLASWTELRHDTVLYAKQSYTENLLCSYPAGFVEPRPEFWLSMGQLASIAHDAISRLSLSGQVSVTGNYGTVVFDLGSIKSKQMQFLGGFSTVMEQLQVMSQKELQQLPFSQSETDFLEDVVERTIDYLGVRRWNGWYPGLFYGNALGGEVEQASGCDVWDALVTDVHTDPPDDIVGDPGAMIHEGVGSVFTMLIAVDNGPDRMVYAGPVFSHYEFEMPMNTRLSDDEWKAKLRNGNVPLPGEWTRSFLVPGGLSLPPRY